MDTIKVHKKQRLDYCVSKDSYRLSLMYVLLTNDNEGNPVLVSTDGTVLAVVPAIKTSQGPIEKDKLIQKDVFKEARKVKTTNRVEIQVDDNGAASVLDQGTAVLTLHSLNDSAYPDWKSVIRNQQKTPSRVVGLDAKKLYDLARALGRDHVILCLPEKDKREEEGEGFSSPITVLPLPDGPSDPFQYGEGMIMPIKVRGASKEVLNRYEEKVLSRKKPKKGGTDEGAEQNEDTESG